MGVGEEDDQQSQQHQQSRHLKVLESFKYTQNLREPVKNVLADFVR